MAKAPVNPPGVQAHHESGGTPPSPAARTAHPLSPHDLAGQLVAELTPAAQARLAAATAEVLETIGASSRA